MNRLIVSLALTLLFPTLAWAQTSVAPTPGEVTPTGEASGSSASNMNGTTDANTDSSVLTTSPDVQLRPRGDRALLRARLAEHPLGGPIAMLAIGVPVAVIFGALSYYVYYAQDVVDCVVDACSGHPNRTAPAVLGAIGGAGLVVGIAGLVMLALRVSRRGRIRKAYRQGELSLTSEGLRLSF